MSNIVAINSAVVPEGQPNPEIIERLESLLEDARAGDIRAISYVAVRSDYCARSWFYAQPLFGTTLLGWLCRLKHSLTESVEGQE